MDVSPLLLSVWVAACATFFSVAGHPRSLWRYETASFASLCRCGADIAFGYSPTVTGFFLLILLGKNSPVGRFFNENRISFYIFPPWCGGRRHLWCLFR